LCEEKKEEDLHTRKTKGQSSQRTEKIKFNFSLKSLIIAWLVSSPANIEIWEKMVGESTDRKIELQ